MLTVNGNASGGHTPVGYDNASANNNVKTSAAPVQVHANPGYLDRSHSDIDPHHGGPNLNPSGPGRHYRQA